MAPTLYKKTGEKLDNINKLLDECDELEKSVMSLASQHPDPSGQDDSRNENNGEKDQEGACANCSHSNGPDLRTRNTPSKNEFLSSAARYSYSKNKNAAKNDPRTSGADRAEDSLEEDRSRNEKNVHPVYKDPLLFSTLQELVTKQPNDIMLWFNNNDSFNSLFDLEDMDRNSVALTLVALGKICSSDLRKTFHAFVNSLTDKPHFLKNCVPTFLASLSADTLEGYHLQSLSHLVAFLKFVQNSSPSSATAVLTTVLPLLRKKCETFMKCCGCYDDVLRNLRSMEERNKYHSDQMRPKKNKPSWKKALQHVRPPENFRTLPVFPDADDILFSEPFLRPNVVEGRYFNTEHYLDVQFRLLREDYIRALRDGVREYGRRMLKRESGISCREARVFLNARILQKVLKKGTMYHLVQFSLADFSSKEWESEKSFLVGSLLCLSSDDFETMMFACVARREPERLKKGLLLVELVEISSEASNISPEKNFAIVESYAYFEAYRHNLKALQELDKDSLPLKDYIINIQKDAKHPRYLDNFTTYDLRPLLVPMDGAHIKREVTEDGTLRFRYEFPEDCRVGRSVQVLQDLSWPSATDMNFESSQYLALKAALTREFALIQGPPGTGKTYVGLRIVQALLHNIDKWFREETNSLPILVVCLTDHALDQFLEGMTAFTDRIIRVGKQGKNAAIYPFELSYLKSLPNHRQQIPDRIIADSYRQRQQVKSLERDIDKLYYLLRKCNERVISEEKLTRYITLEQFLSLKRPAYSEELPGITDDGLVIYDWLLIPPRSGVNLTSEVEDEVEEDAFDSEPSNEEGDDESECSDEYSDFEDLDEIPEGVFIPVIELLSFVKNVEARKKERSKYIKNWLKRSEALDETEASKISDVWDLDLSLRWNLYKHWLEKLVADTREECLKLQALLKAEYQELMVTKREEDFYVLKNAQVVGMTTTGAAKYRNIVRRLNPQILVVEEAAQILESHVVTALAPNTQHVILIGDHQQLRPSPNVQDIAVKYDGNVSLFERMVKNKMRCFKLSVQHRMRPDITELIVPHIYSELKNHRSVTEYENIKGVSKNVYFVTHDCDENYDKDTHSKCNVHEATFLIRLCNYLVQQGYDSSQITVLTTYNRQLSLLKERAEEFPMIKNVRFTVVDSYQGEENDIVLMSLVRNNSNGEIGFLGVANRVCVALSRARKGLYCIGNFPLLVEESELWTNIADTLKRKRAMGQSLPLSCQNHPDVSVEVSEAKDFESIPDGGCTKNCDYRLSCGHVCPLKCHPNDRDHESVFCFKVCLRRCKEGHGCRKICSQECGNCEVPVDYEFAPCGHKTKVPCHEKHSDRVCTENCEKELECGHRCPKKCGEACAEICTEMMDVQFEDCGHVVEAECHKYESIVCDHPCEAVLECGHPCSGDCTKCHLGRLHVTCNEPCDRILLCGHECPSTCAETCPPCELPCENRCGHRRCPRKCGEACDVCTKRCEWHCRHQMCTRLCCDTCTRLPCDEPCELLLNCGHPCIGFCGEPCPEECRVCDSEAVKEIFFGTEEEEDARFVRLEDCNHVFEVSGLDEWMRSRDDRIRMKACPKCGTVVRKNLRYGNVIKDCLNKIERVKFKTCNVEGITRARQRVLTLVEENRLLLSMLKPGPISLYESWKNILTAEPCRNIQQISSIGCFIRIFLQLCHLHFEAWASTSPKPDTVMRDVTRVNDFIRHSTRWLTEFMFDARLTASAQQLEQLSWEAHRLKLIIEFLEFTGSPFVYIPNPYFGNFVHLLTVLKPFGAGSVRVFLRSYRLFRGAFRTPIVNVSALEKDLILKPVDMCEGNWYQCPKGHVYCITECVGAMKEGLCNECNA